MAVFGRTPYKYAILRFVRRKAGLGCLCFFLTCLQGHDFQPQKTDDLQTTSLAQAPDNVELEKIAELFRAFLDKCAESNLYDQIEACLSNLLSLIEQELQETPSRKTFSKRSTVAKSQMFKMADILSTNTWKNSLTDLEIICSSSSKIFGWDEKIKKAISSYYLRRYRWNFIKDCADGPFKVVMTISGAIFILPRIPKLTNFAKSMLKNPGGTLFGEADKDDKIRELQAGLQKTSKRS